MSKLQTKIISDKLMSLAKIAKRDGNIDLATCLVNIATVLLYGRTDVMKLILASTTAAAKTAKDAALRGDPIVNPEPLDEISQRLTEAAETAVLSNESNIASLLEFINAIRASRRQDLMKQFLDAAEILSRQSVGESPEKEVFIVDNKES